MRVCVVTPSTANATAATHLYAVGAQSVSALRSVEASNEVWWPPTPALAARGIHGIVMY